MYAWSSVLRCRHFVSLKHWKWTKWISFVRYDSVIWENLIKMIFLSIAHIWTKSTTMVSLILYDRAVWLLSCDDCRANIDFEMINLILMDGWTCWFGLSTRNGLLFRRKGQMFLRKKTLDASCVLTLSKWLLLVNTVEWPDIFLGSCSWWVELSPHSNKVLDSNLLWVLCRIYLFSLCLCGFPLLSTQSPETCTSIGDSQYVASAWMNMRTWIQVCM